MRLLFFNASFCLQRVSLILVLTWRHEGVYEKCAELGTVSASLSCPPVITVFIVMDLHETW
jgi:hypothetical protein